jgi:hypothetical protein
MKADLQITRYMQRKSHSAVTALSTNRRTDKFFVGWMKRFGNTTNFFVFPLNNEEHPNL